MTASELIHSSAETVKRIEHPRAVYCLECSHDGAIPPAELAHARAIDAEFEAAHPEWRPQYPSALDESRMALSYYKQKVLSLIAAKRDCDNAGIVNRLWTMGEVLMWFREWRKERRRLQALMSQQAGSR